MQLPSAGLARRHLQSRGISPSTVRKFALGYAPDSYFNLKNRNERGVGSLVYRLRDLGFSAQEILDAGLATRSNGRHKWKNRNDALAAITDVVDINQSAESKSCVAYDSEEI